MKNCTKHFIERWVERIIGIKTKDERNLYITQNRDQLIKHANETFDYAQFIYKGQLGDNITRHYYIKDDIVLILNTTEDALITVYKVDLGFTPEINANVRKELLKEIENLHKVKDESDFEILTELESKEASLNLIDEQIKILQQQLDNLKKQRSFKVEEIKMTKEKSSNVELEIKRFTLMLVNSKEYKEDLQSMAK